MTVPRRTRERPATLDELSDSVAISPPTFRASAERQNAVADRVFGAWAAMSAVVKRIIMRRSTNITKERPPDTFRLGAE